VRYAVHVVVCVLADSFSLGVRDCHRQAERFVNLGRKFMDLDTDHFEGADDETLAALVEAGMPKGRGDGQDGK